MSLTLDYSEKLESLLKQPLYGRLPAEQKVFVREVAFEHRFTFQEFRQVVEACRDLNMWGEEDLQCWWKGQISRTDLEGRPLKKHLLRQLQAHMQGLKSGPAVYPGETPGLPEPPRRNPVVSEKSDKKIFGPCPVASTKTICCNLYTIDAVDNCPLGCSYCTIQTFYQDKIVFDEDIAEKLKLITLDKNRFYHIGTGQSSDSLAWGNRNGILDAMFQFAEDHPNILLELKTKSRNIAYLLERDVPNNVVCSWSLNTPIIIQNEEHLTANLEERLQAARTLADKGIKVGFHFHPMIYYEGWERDYPDAARDLMERFGPQEVLFVSLGSLTLIKPVLKKIREVGRPTKILQTELVPDPHGKQTYPDEIKIKMFKAMDEALRPWREKVFIFLCMEKVAIWEAAFGYVYEDNEEFESAFGQHAKRNLQRF